MLKLVAINLKAETLVTRWLIAQQSDVCQRGTGNLILSYDNT